MRRAPRCIEGLVGGARVRPKEHGGGDEGRSGSGALSLSWGSLGRSAPGRSTGFVLSHPKKPRRVFHRPIRGPSSTEPSPRRRRACASSMSDLPAGACLRARCCSSRPDRNGIPRHRLSAGRPASRPGRRTLRRCSSRSVRTIGRGIRRGSLADRVRTGHAGRLQPPTSDLRPPTPDRGMPAVRSPQAVRNALMVSTLWRSQRSGA